MILYQHFKKKQGRVIYLPVPVKKGDIKKGDRQKINFIFVVIKNMIAFIVPVHHMMKGTEISDKPARKSCVLGDFDRAVSPPRIGVDLPICLYYNLSE